MPFNRAGHTLCRTNAAFRHDAREASLHSIQSRINHDPNFQSYLDKTGIEKGIDQAVHYVLSEIAFLNVAPVLFGGERADYIYHREWPIYENFIAGKYDGNHRPQLGLKIISNPLAA
jgi:tRNA-dependent cyclodipeptide synthase